MVEGLCTVLGLDFDPALWGLANDPDNEADAMASELAHGRVSLTEVQAGLERFRSGAGRHGDFS